MVNHPNRSKKQKTVDAEVEFRGEPKEMPSGPTQEQFQFILQQLAELTGKYNSLKQATGGVELLAPEEVPIYEIGEGGYYSADDVLYPAGIQIEDVTGSIVPNEQMIPLNEAAERRMQAYLETLPQAGTTPSHELIIEAASMVLPSFDASGKDPLEARAELQKQILDQAMRLRMKQAGMMPGNDQHRLAVRPHRAGPVPMMSNTRIREGEVHGLGHVMGPAPGRGPVRTRVRAQPLAAAQKAAPPMGTVQNQTIGR